MSAGGTAAGIAQDSSPRLADGRTAADRFLKPGDAVEVRSAGIGILTALAVPKPDGLQAVGDWRRRFPTGPEAGLDKEKDQEDGKQIRREDQDALVHRGFVGRCARARLKVTLDAFAPGRRREQRGGRPPAGDGRIERDVPAGARSVQRPYGREVLASHRG